MARRKEFLPSFGLRGMEAGSLPWGSKEDRSLLGLLAKIKVTVLVTVLRSSLFYHFVFVFAAPHPKPTMGGWLVDLRDLTTVYGSGGRRHQIRQSHGEDPDERPND